MPVINYLAVLVAAVASMVVGGIWYGPLFGKIWVQGMGWNTNDKEFMDKMKKSAGPAYAQQFVGSLLTAFVFAHVLWAFSVASPETRGVVAGLQGGFWMWLGFMLPIKYAEKLWAGKKMKYLCVDLGNSLVTLFVMGVILAVLK